MAASALKLVVEKGPAAGAERVLAGRGLTIGRDPAADLVLPGDDFVSPQHVRIVWSDRGAMLRNHSPNGTLLNGRSVNEAPLASGDKISIGLLYLVTVRGAAAPATAGAPISAAVASPAAPTTTTTAGPALPAWLVAYLALMLVAFVCLGVMRLRGSTAAGLAQVEQEEQQYATAHRYQRGDTDRVLTLLDAASVHERRGDSRSAYEIYRELLSVRQPIDARSPAYLYAASRVAALGGE